MKKWNIDHSTSSIPGSCVRCLAVRQSVFAFSGGGVFPSFSKAWSSYIHPYTKAFSEKKLQNYHYYKILIDWNRWVIFNNWILHSDNWYFILHCRSFKTPFLENIKAMWTKLRNVKSRKLTWKATNTAQKLFFKNQEKFCNINLN